MDVSGTRYVKNIAGLRARRKGFYLQCTECINGDKLKALGPKWQSKIVWGSMPFKTNTPPGVSSTTPATKSLSVNMVAFGVL